MVLSSGDLVGVLGSARPRPSGPEPRHLEWISAKRASGQFAWNGTRPNAIANKMMPQLHRSDFSSYSIDGIAELIPAAAAAAAADAAEDDEEDGGLLIAENLAVGVNDDEGGRRVSGAE